MIPAQHASTAAAPAAAAAACMHSRRSSLRLSPNAQRACRPRPHLCCCMHAMHLHRAPHANARRRTSAAAACMHLHRTQPHANARPHLCCCMHASALHPTPCACAGRPHLWVFLHQVWVVAVRLRHQQHQRLLWLQPRAHQQLRHMVQVGRVRLGGVAQRQQLRLAAGPHRVLQLRLARRDPVEVALQRVDLA